MPRHQISMKDVANCDKLRRAVKQALTRRFPNGVTPLESCPENLILLGGSPGELKHLSTQGRERKIDSLSSGERKGKSPNSDFGRRVVGLQCGFYLYN